MTNEQVYDLFLQYQHLHPPKEKDETYYDPEYEAWEQEVAEENEGVLWPEVQVVPFAAPDVFVSDSPPEDLIGFDSGFDAGEWEDV